MTDYRSYIDSDPAIMLDKPCIKGTRITVELILKKLSEGYSVEELVDNYTSLDRTKILACTAYAADMMSNETLISA